MPESVIILRHPNYDIFPNGINLQKRPQNTAPGHSPLTSGSRSEPFGGFRLEAKNLRQRPINLADEDFDWSELPATKWRYQKDFEHQDSD